MDYREVYRAWSESFTLSEEERAELRSIAGDEKEIEERFYRDLEFGTAGLRGILRVGTNGMNVHVVRRATQGLAGYMLGIPGAAEKGVCIAYDSRKNSELFARESACVLAANGIRVCLFSTLHAVPQLSFAVRHQGCMAGIVITASHNPPKYNGYKVYWSHGGQVAPEQAAEILARIEAVPYFSEQICDYDGAVLDGRITLLGYDEDEAYYAATASVLLRPELLKEAGAGLPIVYTPLHGTGNVPVRTLLARVGVTNVSVVPEQEKPDPAFPTVSAPNPEDPNAFALGRALALRKGACVILATDPDADRLGVCVRERGGAWTTLTGNEIGCLLIEHILSERSRAGTLPKNGVIVKSLVSTRLADAICARYGVELEQVLTGFRFISEKIDEYARTGEKTFLFGFEESFGFLAGGFSRDKDAVCAALLVAEACVCCAQRDMTLYDALCEIYETYGYYKEKQASYTLEGKAGMEKIAACMEALRGAPPASAAGLAVTAFEDYRSGVRRTAVGQTRIPLPASNMLRMELEGGAWIVVRPSGTEPKLKLYIGASAKAEDEVDALLTALYAELNALLVKALT